MIRLTDPLWDSSASDSHLSPFRLVAGRLLAGHEIRPSTSRVGNPHDNAKAESFMKTLSAAGTRRSRRLGLMRLL